MKAEYSLVLRIRRGGLAGFARRHLAVDVVQRTVVVRIVMALKRKSTGSGGGSQRRTRNALRIIITPTPRQSAFYQNAFSPLGWAITRLCHQVDYGHCEQLQSMVKCLCV
jgi:hypothetical protein